MRVFDRVICLVNSHFAAHKRNADFDHIFRTLSFTRPSVELNSGSVGLCLCKCIVEEIDASRLPLNQMKNLSCPKHVWLYVWVVSAIGYLVSIMMRRKTWSPKDVLTGLEKRIN